MGFPTSLLRPLITKYRPLLTLTHLRPPSPIPWSQAAAPKPKASSSTAASKPKPKADKPAKPAAKSKAKVPLSNRSPNGTEDSDEEMAGPGSDVDDFDGKSGGAPTPGAKGLGKDIKELGGQAGKGKNASEMYQKVSEECLGVGWPDRWLPQAREETAELTWTTARSVAVPNRAHPQATRFVHWICAVSHPDDVGV